MHRFTDARRLAPALLVAALLTLAGCGDGDGGGDDDTQSGATPTTATPTTTAPTTPTESPEPTTAPTEASATPTTPKLPPTSSTARPPDEAPTATTPTAKARRSPVGVWRNREMRWVLRVKPSGRFVEDFDGVKRIRSGRWVQKTRRVVVFKGGDGYTTVGKRFGNKMRVQGTVLVRVRPAAR